MLRALKAFLQLGPLPSFLYLWYQFKLRSGLLLLQTPIQKLQPEADVELITPWPIPRPEALQASLGSDSSQLLAQADRILDGTVPLFGADWQNLDLRPPTKQHWTAFSASLPNGRDIKPIWEIGRFGWATILARAYQLNNEEAYAEAFWNRFEVFSRLNPPNLGPHWSSAQEVSLRMMSLLFSYALIQDAEASTPARRALLAASLAAHAVRIPPTLAYACAQDNNHLLSEAAGLISAASALPRHPQADRWLAQGQSIFSAALRRQIDSAGRYSQHSSNYQRLALQLALWVQLLLRSRGQSLPEDVLDKLALATQWQLDLCEPSSGEIANLGPNDGAYILPLSLQPFADHRPVLQAAAATFLGRRPFTPGPWDEMSLWLANPRSAPTESKAKSAALRLEGEDSWAYLRAATFNSRPGHADQLHLDLWWRGLNIARDAGTYLYTAPATSEWNNALAATRAHNSLVVAGQDQMQRAGRFLWLDWAQGEVLEEEFDADGLRILARAAHNGYRHLNLRHERLVRLSNSHAEQQQWEIVDQVECPSGRSGEVQATLYWHLPDLQWRLEDKRLHLQSDKGPIRLSVESKAPTQLSLIRTGEVLVGPAQPDPILGWYSPSYGQKEAALTLLIEAKGAAPLSFTSRWSLANG